MSLPPDCRLEVEALTEQRLSQPAGGRRKDGNHQRSTLQAAGVEALDLQRDIGGLAAQRQQGEQGSGKGWVFHRDLQGFSSGNG